MRTEFLSIEYVKSHRNARHIEAVLDGSEGLYGSQVPTRDGIAYLISDVASVSKEEQELLGDITAFQKKYVSRPDFHNVRGDCENMAKLARQSWSKDAEAVVRPPLADGLLHYRFSSVDDPLLEFDQHFINYKILPDGSILAFDLTAEYNIDRNAGNYRVLAIRAQNETRLLTYLQKLFSGTWSLNPLPPSHLVYE